MLHCLIYKTFSSRFILMRTKFTEIINAESRSCNLECLYKREWKHMHRAHAQSRSFYPNYRNPHYRTWRYSLGWICLRVILYYLSDNGKLCCSCFRPKSFRPIKFYWVIKPLLASHFSLIRKPHYRQPHNHYSRLFVSHWQGSSLNLTRRVAKTIEKTRFKP